MENYRRAPVDGRLGIWLREMRQKRGWSIVHVIRQTKACTTQHLSMVENGRRRPSLTLVTQLCEAYGVPPEQFEELEEMSVAFSPADRDRYTLMRIICVLDENQRYKIHQAVTPMLDKIIKRRVRDVAITKEGSRSAHTAGQDRSRY